MGCPVHETKPDYSIVQSQLPALTLDHMTLDELRSRWEKRRDEYANLRAQIDAATLIEQLLAELQTVSIDQSATLLTLTQAAVACGYSADHLGRLVRTGQLTNYGRRHAPRVRLGDLPQRARRWTSPGVSDQTKYDPVADAYSLRIRQRPGARDGQQ